jgi:hypothetical protein
MAGERFPSQSPRLLRRSADRRRMVPLLCAIDVEGVSSCLVGNHLLGMVRFGALSDDLAGLLTGDDAAHTGHVVVAPQYIRLSEGKRRAGVTNRRVGRAGVRILL